MMLIPRTRTVRQVAAGLALVLLAAACAPPAPSPTPAPARPTEAPRPAASAPSPAAAPAPSPVAAPSPAAAPGPAASPSPAAAPAAPAAAARPAASFDARAVEDFYRGKTVKIVVGFAAGGGFDLYSRLIAKYIGKYIPGNPTVIVENMPGASSILAMNHVYGAAPRDGTVIANVIGSVALQQLFGVQGVQFDMARVHYLGMPVGGTLVVTVPKAAGVSKIEDVLEPSGKQLVVGTTAPGAGNHDGAVLLKEVLGANLKIVSGYAGTSQIRLAMESNEVQSIFNPWESTKITNKEQVDRGEWLLLAQFLEKPHSDLPNVPLVTSLAKNDEQRQLLLFGGIIPNQFEKVYVLAPEVPADRAAALQSAFLQALADRELLADAEKAKQDIVPVPGDEVKQRIVEFMGMSADLKARLQKVMLP